jgi:1-acyl-sn-glycerol-3-phosphate acyltransferase
MRSVRPPSSSGRTAPGAREATLLPTMLAVARLALFLLDTMVCILLALLASIGDRQGRRAYVVAKAWARLNVRLCGVRVEVEGLEHLDPTQAYVFMANHRSAFDILALVVALRQYELRWVAKAELRRIPGFGAALQATRQIFIDRSNHERAVATLAAARGRVRGGESVVFFPEGTRSSGPLLPFKKGGFVFAIETGAPIVPIGISGPRSLFDPRGLLCRWRATVRVVVRPPILTGQLDLDDRDVVLQRVRRAIGGAMNPPRPLFASTPEVAQKA